MSGGVRITRRLQFAAGHRLLGHEGKCAHVHGHNYVVLLHARSREGLDSVGRVVDFSVLKERFGAWIERNWDHGFIVNERDTMRALLARWNPQSNALELSARDEHLIGQGVGLVPTRGQKLYVMQSNPTAENMAELLLLLGHELLGDTGCVLDGVELWETENCKAEVWR